MNCIVKQSDLKAAIALIWNTIGHNAKTPSVKNILLTAQGGWLWLEATNLEQWIQHRIPAQIIASGKMSVPAKLLRSTVALLCGDVNLHMEHETAVPVLHVEATRSFSTIHGLDAAESYTSETLADDASWSLVFDAEALRTALAQVVFAAGTTAEYRPELMTVHVVASGQTALFVATDGFKMAVRHCVIEPLEGERSTTIPAKTMQLVAEVFRQGTVEMQVYPQQQLVVFEDDKTRLTSIADKSKYVDWKRPFYKGREGLAFVQVDRAALLNAIKITQLYAIMSANVVQLRFGYDWLVLGSGADLFGANETAIPTKGEPFMGYRTVYLDARHLVAAIGHLRANTITCGISIKPSWPIVFGEDECTEGVMIMPMSVREQPKFYTRLAEHLDEVPG